MKYKRAYIDSLNLSADNIEGIFISHEDYNIQIVKSKSIFEPLEWRKAFGEPLSQHIIDARIIHTHLGLMLPLKTFSMTPQSQTVEFAGLKGYNHRSELLLNTLEDLQSQLQHTKVMRIDVAIDYEGDIPQRIIKTLLKGRKPFIDERYPNITYYKTDKEKRTNRVMDIKIYDKARKEKLGYPLTRLEFCFKSPYLGRLELINLESIIKKMEKTIKRMTGMTVKIMPHI